MGIDRVEPRNLQEKPKEKTVFNVKLEAFDAAAKPKIIREVKAMVPNLTLIEVRSPAVVPLLFSRSVLTTIVFCVDLPPLHAHHCPFFLRAPALTDRPVAPAGEEVCRVAASDPQGEPVERGCGEAQKDLYGPGRDRRARVSTMRRLPIEGTVRVSGSCQSVHSTLIAILLPPLLRACELPSRVYKR